MVLGDYEALIENETAGIKATVRSLGKALYFCVPRNDKLLSYWDTVADRLFKIEGVEREITRLLAGRSGPIALPSERANMFAAVTTPRRSQPTEDWTATRVGLAV